MMRMRLFLCVLAVVLVLGCSKPEQYVDCERILDKNERHACRYNLTVYNMDAAKCKEIGDSNLSKICVNQIAMIAKTEYACYQHARASDKNDCEAMVARAQREAKLTKGNP